MPARPRCPVIAGPTDDDSGSNRTREKRAQRKTLRKLQKSIAAKPLPGNAEERLGAIQYRRAFFREIIKPAIRATQQPDDD